MLPPLLRSASSASGRFADRLRSQVRAATPRGSGPPAQAGSQNAGTSGATSQPSTPHLPPADGRAARVSPAAPSQPRHPPSPVRSPPQHSSSPRNVAAAASSRTSKPATRRAGPSRQDLFAPSTLDIARSVAFLKELHSCVLRVWLGGVLESEDSPRRPCVFCVQARPSPLNTAGGSCFTWRRARPKGTPPRGAWHPALGGAHLLARSDVCGIRGRWCVDAHGYQEPIAPLITEERQRLKKLSSYRRPRPSPAAASPSRGPRDPPTSSSGRRRAPVASSGSFASGGVSETLRQARTAPLSGSAAGRSGSRNSRHNTTRPDVGGGESARPPVAVRDAFTTPAPQPSPSQARPAAQAVSSPPGQPQQQPQQQQQQQQRQQPSATARAAARASARRRRTGGAAKTKPSSTPDVAPTPPTKRGRERDRGGRTSHGASAAVGGQEAQAAGTPKAGAPRRAGRNVGASGDAAAEPRAGASRRSRAAKTSSDGRGGDGDRRSNRGRRNEGKATKRGGGARRGKGAPSGRSGNNAPDAETMRAERLAYFDKLLASQS